MILSENWKPIRGIGDIFKDFYRKNFTEGK